MQIIAGRSLKESQCELAVLGDEELLTAASEWLTSIDGVRRRAQRCGDDQDAERNWDEYVGWGHVGLVFLVHSSWRPYCKETEKTGISFEQFIVLHIFETCLFII